MTGVGVACAVLGLFIGVMAMAGERGSSWLWTTVALLGIAVVLTATEAVGRGLAASFMAASVAFVAGCLLLVEDAVARRGMPAPYTAFRDLLAAAAFAGLWMVTLVVARTGDAAWWLLAAGLGVSSIALWTHALRKLAGEITVEGRGDGGRP